MAPSGLRSSRGGTSAHWSDGATREDGGWSRPPSPPPHDTALYAVIAAYNGAQLSAVSSVLEFRVGSAWPDVGAYCGDDGADGGDPSDAAQSTCDSPVRSLVCQGGMCRLLCASNADCQDQAGQRCELPDSKELRGCLYPAVAQGDGGAGD